MFEPVSLLLIHFELPRNGRGRTSHDAPTGHKLFNFTSTSLQSRRWAHIKRSAIKDEAKPCRPDYVSSCVCSDFQRWGNLLGNGCWLSDACCYGITKDRSFDHALFLARMDRLFWVDDDYKGRSTSTTFRPSILAYVWDRQSSIFYSRISTVEVASWVCEVSERRWLLVAFHRISIPSLLPSSKE
jgi:hypothetical protein